MNSELLNYFFTKYIAKTPCKSIVPDRRLFVCQLQTNITDACGINYLNGGVCLTTQSLKHLFDKKPAEEFMFILDHLYSITKYPNQVYRNKKGGRGQFCLVTKIKGDQYICIIEIDQNAVREVYIPTVFRIRDRNYLSNYTLLWDWGNGEPHRHVTNS